MPIQSDTYQSAQRFMWRYRKGRFAFNDLDRVIDLALSEDIPQAETGAKIFFGQIIEPLCDTFLEQDRKVLEKVLAHLISRLRLLPAAGELHEKLEQWELKSEKDLLDRMERISKPKTFEPGSLKKIKKVFVLSRVTLGADVMLNSPVMEKMMKIFPAAEIVFLGSAKNGTLLKSHGTGVRIHPLNYDRRGVLLNRFLAWLEVIRAVEEEIAALEPGEDYIIVNTDSRLVQSGLLPIISPALEEKHYFYWQSSVNPIEWRGTSQGEDLLKWLEATFGPGPGDETLYPALQLTEEDTDFAAKVYELFNTTPRPLVISMSFGVGGNREKRVKYRSEIVSRYERELVRKLLAHGAAIILDKGFGREEMEQANAILKAGREMGIGVAEVSEAQAGIIGAKSPGVTPSPTRLVAFQGTINKFAALIDRSDLYIGYDSLGQHLAAALGRDVITVFAGYPSERFPRRWKPMGKGTIRIIEAGSGPFKVRHQEELVKKVLLEVFGGVGTFFQKGPDPPEAKEKRRLWLAITPKV